MIQVLYTCDKCGIKDAPVTVAHRKEGENILVWMKHVQQRLADDHLRRSPNCRITEFTNAKIPLQDDKGIGMP